MLHAAHIPCMTHSISLIFDSSSDNFSSFCLLPPCFYLCIFGCLLACMAVLCAMRCVHFSHHLRGRAGARSARSEKQEMEPSEFTSFHQLTIETSCWLLGTHQLASCSVRPYIHGCEDGVGVGTGIAQQRNDKKQVSKQDCLKKINERGCFLARPYHT